MLAILALVLLAPAKRSWRGYSLSTIWASVLPLSTKSLMLIHSWYSWSNVGAILSNSQPLLLASTSSVAAAAAIAAANRSPRLTLPLRLLTLLLLLVLVLVLDLLLLGLGRMHHRVGLACCCRLRCCVSPRYVVMASSIGDCWRWWCPRRPLLLLRILPPLLQLVLVLFGCCNYRRCCCVLCQRCCRSWSIRS